MKQLKDCIYLQTTHSTHGLEQTWEEYQSAVTLDDPSTLVTVSGATEANTSSQELDATNTAAMPAFHSLKPNGYCKNHQNHGMAYDPMSIGR